MYYCIEEQLVRGVVSFSGAGEKSMDDLQGSKGVGCDFQVIVEVEVNEGYVDGREFGS